jgi:hypothetical protein
VWIRRLPGEACWEARCRTDDGWHTFLAAVAAIDADRLAVDVAGGHGCPAHRCLFADGHWSCPCGEAACAHLHVAGGVRRHFMAWREDLLRLGEGGRAAVLGESFTEEKP